MKHANEYKKAAFLKHNYVNAINSTDIYDIGQPYQYMHSDKV